MGAFELIILAFVSGTLVLATTYVVVRVASVAHFRTKLEYFRDMLKAIDAEGDANGKK